jgi:hypothetical protein
MSYDLAHGGGREVSLPDARRYLRASSRHQTGALTRIAGANADTDVALGKIDDYTMAVGAGMAAVARIGQMQRQLEQLTPEVSGRLTYLADSHLVGVDGLLTNYRHDLRRR